MSARQTGVMVENEALSGNVETARQNWLIYEERRQKGWVGVVAPRGYVEQQSLSDCDLFCSRQEAAQAFSDLLGEVVLPAAVDVGVVRGNPDIGLTYRFRKHIIAFKKDELFLKKATYGELVHENAFYPTIYFNLEHLWDGQSQIYCKAKLVFGIKRGLLVKEGVFEKLENGSKLVKKTNYDKPQPYKDFEAFYQEIVSQK